MDWTSLVALAITSSLVIYLTIALFKPDKFV